MSDQSPGEWMKSEIEEQVDLLSIPHRLTAQAKCVAALRPKVIVFAARGSSDNACLYGRYLLEVGLRIPCVLSAPSVLTRYGADLAYPEALVVGASQSAAAPDVAAVLEHARKKGHQTLSITNLETGAVVDAAEHHIFIGAGEERAVAATKTYTLTMLALFEMARALGADLPAPDGLGPAVERALQDDTTARIAEALGRARLAFTLGRGYHFALAQEAALKLMECALLGARSYSPADFAHGPIALAGEGTSALLFGADDRDATAKSVRERLADAGAEIFHAAVDRQLPETLQPFAATVIAQRIALDAAVAKGLDPDRPRNLTKVTKTR